MTRIGSAGLNNVTFCQLLVYIIKSQSIMSNNADHLADAHTSLYLLVVKTTLMRILNNLCRTGFT